MAHMKMNVLRKNSQGLTDQSESAPSGCSHEWPARSGEGRMLSDYERPWKSYHDKKAGLVDIVKDHEDKILMLLARYAVRESNDPQ